ncbi:MAG: hypothetical protein LBP83_09315 [Dysgonamonadaceae bacterium]|jgi:2-hydroxy-3-keto-5-methylthiopentenyl-1-phosphate phosphatase|nr:hypothetical protein [Dysgonamonadaceae bacterium]
MKVDREIDFYLLSNGKEYLWEVKLMGKGDPESVDAIIVRNSNVFVANTLLQHCFDDRTHFYGHDPISANYIKQSYGISKNSRK